jgi:hypothetical protein
MACGKPWPCDPARESLAAQLGPTPLAMYMWANLEEAVNDLTALPASEAFHRFIAWTRHV